VVNLAVANLKFGKLEIFVLAEWQPLSRSQEGSHDEIQRIKEVYYRIPKPWLKVVEAHQRW